MIITVTANPSIDMAYKLDNLNIDEVNRTSNVSKTPGGKGLNVTRVIKQLGGKVLSTGFIGGKNGEFIEEELHKIKIKSSFYKTDKNTRNCIAILHEGNQTEILESGEELSEFQEKEFIEHFKEIVKEDSIITISGSTPPGIGENFYKKLIEIAVKKNCKVILDSSGKNLKSIVLGSKVKPYAIKPNEHEINHIENLDLKSEEEFRSYLMSPVFKDIPLILMTKGEDGALIKFEDVLYKVEIPKINPVNPVGSGDSTVAGLAYGLDNKLGFENTVKLAMACGILNALEEKTGHIDEDRVEEFMEKVKISRLS